MSGLTTTVNLSVVIPNCNHTRFLRDCVDSVLAQARRPLEIIVVDDGSTDGCADVAAAYGREVRYLRQENQGLAGARNTGIRAARGDFVGLLDADDLWLPSFVESWAALLREHPDASVFYCEAQAIDDAGRRLPQRLGGPPVESSRLRGRLLRANFLIPSTIVMNRAHVAAAGLFDTGFRSAQGCEDWDLWLRLLPSRRFVGSGRCHVLYRVHGASLSADPAGMQRSARLVVLKRFGPDDGDRSRWSDEKRRAYGGLYRYCLLSSVQRRNDWREAADLLHRAITIDSDLAHDVDLFYELALGAQPVGYRGTDAAPNLTETAGRIRSVLADVVERPDVRALRRTVLGTACRALGLAAYNARQYRASRRFLASALLYQPRLFRDRVVAGDFVKSFVRGAL